MSCHKSLYRLKICPAAQINCVNNYVYIIIYININVKDNYILKKSWLHECKDKQNFNSKMALTFEEFTCNNKKHK